MGTKSTPVLSGASFFFYSEGEKEINMCISRPLALKASTTSASCTPERSNGANLNHTDETEGVGGKLEKG